MSTMELPDDSVNAETVTVKLIRQEAPPRFLSQRNCSHVGLPPPSFLALLRKHSMPAASVGKLRVASAADVEAALKLSAKVRGPRVCRAGDVPDDIASALAAAGCTYTPKGGAK